MYVIQRRRLNIHAYVVTSAFSRLWAIKENEELPVTHRNIDTYNNKMYMFSFYKWIMACFGKQRSEFKGKIFEVTQLVKLFLLT